MVHPEAVPATAAAFGNRCDEFCLSDPRIMAFEEQDWAECVAADVARDFSA